jgi:ornithine cyclodeaminase
MMIPFLDGAELKRALSYPLLIAALREAFQQDINVPRRHVHTLSDADASVLLLMPVWQAGQQMGVKLVTVAPANRDRSLPTVQALFILFDTTTGTPLALMDGEELTLRRTAAASALASTYLSRSDSRRLLIIGTGQLAPCMAVAHCAVRPITQVTVWGRSAENIAHTMQRIRAAGLPDEITLVAADDLRQACLEADIISCATTSKVPLVLADAVRPGTHIDLVGGFRADMREADDDLMSQANVFVDTFSGALAEAGDLVQPIAAGLMGRESVQAELADLASGTHAGRLNTIEITVFKSVGTALEDLCAANLAWASHQAQLKRNE